MAQVLKRRRLVNPGQRRRRRPMTAKQIKYFGTARQRAALRAGNRRRNAGPYSIRKTAKRLKTTGNKYKRYHLHHLRETARVRKPGRKRWGAGRRRNQGDAVSSVVGRVEHAAERAIDRIEDLATEALSRGINPGRRRRNRAGFQKMDRRYRRGGRSPQAIYKYAQHRKRRIKWVRSQAKRNPGRRRNPGGLALTGNTAAVVGILGGATVTKIITGFLPSNLTSGFTGMLTTGVVAMVTGNVTGRMTKNRSLGNWMTVGGLLIVGLQLAGQLFPQLQLPFGLSTPTSGTSGLGLISSSNFYVPQVNLPGSMASFVTPAGIPAPVMIPATAMHGLGNAMNQGLRRMGRLR